MFWVGKQVSNSDDSNSDPTLTPRFQLRPHSDPTPIPTPTKSDRLRYQPRFRGADIGLYVGRTWPTWSSMFARLGRYRHFCWHTLADIIS